LTGCEALVTHAAAGDVAASTLAASRHWPEEEWAAAEESLRGRGWLDASCSFTASGREHRQAIESRTDELALAQYAAIGDANCERLRKLVRPASRSMATVFG
jgi:hypothetical protein